MCVFCEVAILKYTKIAYSYNDLWRFFTKYCRLTFEIHSFHRHMYRQFLHVRLSYVTTYPDATL